MKKSILLFSFFITLSAVAQRQKVSYTYYFNDPTKITKQKVYLDLLTLDGSSIGAGAHGFYQPIKLLTINGLFRYQYGDLVKSQSKASTNPIKHGFHGEASAQFKFAGYNKKKEKRTPITVHGNSTSKTTVTVKAKVNRSYSVRGGLMLYRSWVVANSDAPFISNGISLYDKDKGLFANQTGTCLFAGYAGKKVRKVGVDIDGYGKRRAYLTRTFFIDGIVGGTLLSDVTYNNINYDIKDTKRDNVGYRIGWEWEENGTDVRIELGKKPGFNSQTLMPINYFMMTFGFRIYGKEIFIFKDDTKK